MSTWTRTHCLALLKQRCPNCHTGQVFHRPTRMNRSCPGCGLLFEREEGYFLGAMYVSYTLSTAVLLVGVLIIHLLQPELDLGWAVLIATVAYLPLVPLVFRYSRVIWIYWDRYMWPMTKDSREEQLQVREIRKE